MTEKSNEWYTPARYVDAAREVMGSIDLDPASCEVANQTVRATRYYSAEDNGLFQPWIAKNVWLNPPFGRDLTQANKQRSAIFKWVGKLIHHYECGDIQQSVVLTTVRTDTPWFSALWNYPICFTERPVRFLLGYHQPSRPNAITSNHIHGTAFTYLGPNEQRFIDTFSQFGPVIPSGVAVRKVIY